MEVKGDIITTGGFTITKDIFNKGADIGDSEKQNYFIEVLPLDVSAYSKRFGVSSDGLMEVEKTKSTAVVKAPQHEAGKKEECFCNRDFKPEEIKAIIKQLRLNRGGHKNLTDLWYDQTKTQMNDKAITSFINEINSNFEHFNIKTCAQKMHFLAQASVETGEFSLSREKDNGKPLKYDPWRGHGLLQLSLKAAYIDYAKTTPKDVYNNPKLIGEDLHLTVHSGCWEWSEFKKAPNDLKSEFFKKWDKETAGKSLNGLATFGDKYLELISVLLNGRNSEGIPNNWAERKSAYNFLRNFIFKYDWYHGGKKDQPVDAKDVVTYHIYADGKVDRHISKKIKAGYEQKYKYVYHDSNDKKYDICIVDWIEIDKVKHVGKTVVEKGYISHETFNVKGVNQKHVYKYADGRVIASGDAGEGGGTITRKYAKAGGKTIIIKVPEPLSYNSGNVKVNLKFENTIRTYMGRDHFAALIGALADCDLSLISEGSAMKDGTCFPSVSHTNGESIDTDYLILSDTQKYVNSMAKFGFKTMLYKPGMKLKKPSGVVTFKEDSHHSAHLHCGSSSIPVTEIKE